MPTQTMITATINGRHIEAPQGTSILDAAMMAHIKIPTLCKHPDLPPTAACGICIVKVAGSNKMLRACCTPLEQGMNITTHDADIVAIRRSILELILSKHPNECFTCGRNGACELQTMAADFGIRNQAYENIVPDLEPDTTTKAIVLEPRKCISCGRCIVVCQKMQNVWALCFMDRGFDTRISPAGEIGLAESPCIGCGQCSAHCPTGAIFEHDDTEAVWAALNNPKKHCVVQIAPAVRVALGEAFGYEPGTNLTGKIYAALRSMGFETVFDTNFGADVTIMEEGTEFLQRFTQRPDELPLITSCCPAWVDFLEKRFGDMLHNFSSCKSPHEIVGVLTKTYYAQKQNINPADICMVSIMPCTAKKSEISRSKDMYASGYQDVDYSLTTRELARMIKQAGIDFENLPDEEADQLLGAYTGAGTIFGVTGGVMEAALRTAYKLITNNDMPDLNIQPVRGLEGVKEGELVINGESIRVAVAHGMGNVEQVLEKVREAKENNEEPPYHFIEVMACPGGCIGGGGQPYGVTDELRMKRAAGLYTEDEQMVRRCSHDNPMVQELYKEFLEHPISEKAHKLLHTKYTARPTYVR